ncbi:uncharacterized protein K452DRAFT_227235, partial [Aplosporella prunicola CBS 121167]
RYRTLQTFSTQAPDVLRNTTTFKSHEVRYPELLTNCEDVVMIEEEGVALLSCDVGRDGWNTVMGTFINPNISGAIFQWYYSDPDADPKPIALEGIDTSIDFHPLGINYDAATSTLAIVNHASTGPTIELFSFTPWAGFGRAAAFHVRTIKHPLLHAPNQVLPLSATDFIVTNDHFFTASKAPLLNKAENYLALPGGTVVHVDLSASPDPRNESGLATAADVKVSTLASVPFANGVVRLGDSTLAVASTTRRSVQLFNMTYTTEGEGAEAKTSVDLKLVRELETPFLVDNLSVDSAGTLLAAGHAHAPALAAVEAARESCLHVQTYKGAWGEREWKDAEACTAGKVSPSWVAEWKDGEWRDLLVGASVFGCSTTAVRDLKEKKIIVGGLYERGILFAEE